MNFQRADEALLFSDGVDEAKKGDSQVDHSAPADHSEQDNDSGHKSETKHTEVGKFLEFI